MQNSQVSKLHSIYILTEKFIHEVLFSLYPEKFSFYLPAFHAGDEITTLAYPSADGYKITSDQDFCEV